MPKGVLGCHKGLAHFVAWQRQQFAVTPDARCAQLTAWSFDVVLKKFSSARQRRDAVPARLTTPGIRRRRRRRRCAEGLERERITHVHAVPALVASWLAHARSGVALRSLQYTFFAGEPLTGALVQKWRAACSESTRIVNLYGATEATLAQCFYVVPPNPASGVQPVGSPLPDTQALVLTKNPICAASASAADRDAQPISHARYVNAADEEAFEVRQEPVRDDDGACSIGRATRGANRPDGTLEILGRARRPGQRFAAVRVELEE